MIQEFTKRGKPTLRVFDFSGVSTLKDAFVGMWALPDTFPKITLDSLTPNLDLAITPRPARAARRPPSRPSRIRRIGAARSR